MQIVIDIDDDIAHGIIDGQNDEPRNIVRSYQATIADAIKNGTPLPKGHGRLIDADALNFNADYNEPLISKLDFDNASTIIEADKEE